MTTSSQSVGERRPGRGRLSLTLALVVTMAVTSCGGDGDDGSSPATTSPASTVPGSGDCLVGTWALDTAEFVDNIAAIPGMPNAQIAPLDGVFGLEMRADGTFSAVRDGWGFSVGTPQGDLLIEINGSEEGTWSADEGTLTISSDSSDLTVDAAIVADGQELPIPGGQLPVDVPEGIASGARFSCDDATLTLDNGGVESVFRRR